MNQKTLSFDDIEIGQLFETAQFDMTPARTIAFAAEYDPQSMHLNEQAAMDGPFGQLTASGWHTLSLTMKLMAEAKPLGETQLVGVGVNDIVFQRPVYPGISIKARAEVVSKQVSSKPGRGFVSLKVKTLDANSGEILLQQKWTIMVPR